MTVIVIQYLLEDPIVTHFLGFIKHFIELKSTITFHNFFDGWYKKGQLSTAKTFELNSSHYFIH